MRRVFSLLVVLATVTVEASDRHSLALRSQKKAAAVIDAAVRAHLGSAAELQSVRLLKLQVEGPQWSRLQMPTPEPPFQPGRYQESLLFDLHENRVRSEQRIQGAGLDLHNLVLLSSSGGTNYDLRARTATPIQPAQLQQRQFVQYHRRHPLPLLRQALGNPTSLRYLGEQTLDGKKHQVVSFAMPDAIVGLYVNGTSHLVSKYELTFVDAVSGDAASEIFFRDYAMVDGVPEPRRYTWYLAGDLMADYTMKAQRSGAAEPKAFEFAEAGFTRISAPQLEARVETLAPGVYVMHNIVGNNLNSMAVEFRDFILVVEAPGTSAGADALIRKIKETIPDKPIRYVALTHHHGDHIGGLRSFIAEGATVVTTPSNRKTIEALASSSQRDRLAREPRKLQIQLVADGRHRFTDGERVAELIDIGPHPHSRELFIVHLPKERILFQGDLFFMPTNTFLGYRQPTVLAFAQWLKEKGAHLQIEKIAGVHGPTGTMEDLRRATEAGP